MGIFLDTGFFLGIYHPKDSHHKASCNILKGLGTGQYGLIYSSLYIVSEVTTLLLILIFMELRNLFQYCHGLQI